MNALMSSRPRRASCSEYLSSMFGAAISSMTPRLTVLPQNSVNQRPTTALLSACLRMAMILMIASGRSPTSVDDPGNALGLAAVQQTPVLAFESKLKVPTAAPVVAQSFAQATQSPTSMGENHDC